MRKKINTGRLRTLADVLNDEDNFYGPQINNIELNVLIECKEFPPPSRVTLEIFPEETIEIDVWEVDKVKNFFRRNRSEYKKLLDQMLYEDPM